MLVEQPGMSIDDLLKPAAVLVNGRVRHPGLKLAQLLLYGCKFGYRRQGLLQHVPAVGHQRFLFQSGPGQPGRPEEFAPVEGDLSRYELHESRFASPIRPDQPDPLAYLELEAHVLKDRAAGQVDPDSGRV
jgi:hypothetical protein